MSTEITNYAPPRHMTLDQSIRAWLDEKRADSVRTADAYEDTLKDFRDTLQSAGLDLDSEPALVAPLAQGWARSSKREGGNLARTLMAMACWIACNKIRSIFSRSSVEPRFFLQRLLHTGITNLLARFPTRPRHRIGNVVGQ